MLTWESEVAPRLGSACRACGAKDLSRPLVTTAHQSDAGVDCTFDLCSQCGSLTLRGEMLAFEHLYDRDEALFIRSYVESAAGPWEMLWPVGLVADGRERSLLEVGCGYGFTVDWWHRCMNADAIGCDPAAYAAAGRALLGNHIHNAMLADVPEARERQFDLIYASEVLEHVDDPVAFIHELAARLTPRGILTLTTPAAEFVAPQNTDNMVVAALAPGFHGVLFSEQRLGALLREAGFANVITRRYNERLVCWCSAAPVHLRQDAEELRVSYLRYLADTVERTSGNGAGTASESTQLASLRTGAAYRLYKEYALRGQRVQAQEWHKATHDDLLLLDHSGDDIEAAIDAFLDTCDGSFATFLSGARLHLPQVCFIDGQLAESDQQFAVAARWYQRCARAMTWIAGSSRLGNVEGAAFVWPALAGLARSLVATNRSAEAADVALLFAQSIATRDSPFASVPEPVVAASCLLQTLVALEQNGGAEFYSLLDRMAAENQPAHPLPTAIAALASARHWRDTRGDRAKASGIAKAAIVSLDDQADTAAGRWLGRTLMNNLRQGLSEFVERPASFSSLFAR